MVNRKELVSFINNYLNIDEFQDYCPNGLQVEGKKEIKHIITGVSACVELFEKAVDLNADMVIVHHGLFWNGMPAVITGSRRERIAHLINHNINLVAYHLPLDSHPESGNNAVLASLLGLKNIQSFGMIKGKPIGFAGELEEETDAIRLFEQIKEKINPSSQIFSFGPKTIRSLAIVSGGAPEMLSAAIDMGVDLYLTGEATEWIYHLAREEKIHFVAAGHHATEKFGIRRLGELLAEQFNLEVNFVDIPNPI